MLKLTKWLIVVAPLLCTVQIAGQTLTLTEAQAAARDNYPLIRQKDLIAVAASINVNNLSKTFLPQLSVIGQASYQSDVTRVDVPIPGVKIDGPAKDQYRLAADISQLIYDGGQNKTLKNIERLKATTSMNEVEVELHKVRDRVNQVFLGALLIEQQLRQTQLLEKDIQTGINRAAAQVENGVAFRSGVDMLRAELLRTRQRRIELNAVRKSLLETLGLLTNRVFSDDIKLALPINDAESDSGNSAFRLPDTTLNSRPELRWFESQRNLLGGREKLLATQLLPKASLFLQGGYGRPGLNMLNNQFDFFSIGGFRFNWSLSSLYTRSADRRLIEIEKEMVDIRKGVFMLNATSELKEQQNEINKIRKLIEADAEIIALRQSVTAAALAQLENGVISASDYLREINADDLARQTLILHKIQLAQAQIKYQTLTGK